MTEGDSLSVVCPVCQARIAKPCDGLAVDQVHAARNDRVAQCAQLGKLRVLIDRCFPQ
jgi:hypothetical protein